jgi:hypothetical protein
LIIPSFYSPNEYCQKVCKLLPQWVAHAYDLMGGFAAHVHKIDRSQVDSCEYWLWCGYTSCIIYLSIYIYIYIYTLHNTDYVLIPHYLFIHNFHPDSLL